MTDWPPGSRASLRTDIPGRLAIVSEALDLSRSALETAPTLLGAVLRHGPVAARITEVEAYMGAEDPASHAHRGETPRTLTMFGPCGRAYIYFSYGMHWAINVVCGPDGIASGVLLRAGEVIDGIELARERRGGVADRALARGPACLTQALAITGELKGMNLLAGGELSLSPAPVHPAIVNCGPRTGVSRAADHPWRFWIAGDRTVSVYRRSPKAPEVTDPRR